MNYLSSFIAVLIFICLTLGLSAQTIDCSRIATLTDGDYNLSGSAILERFDDGSIQLRLGNDFITDAGPDVQIFLSNDSTSIDGALMIADIGQGDGMSHFQGALTLPINDSITMAQYEFVVLRCITFRAFWGGGRLGAPTCSDPGDGGVDPPDGGGDTTMVCLESIVATTDWASEVTVCPNDGMDDFIPFRNTEQVPAGDDYAYIITDVNSNISSVQMQDSFNFEGSGLEANYVFGVSYRGMLMYSVGASINTITSDSCALISSLTTFLTVKKESCLSAFECETSVSATTNWATEVTICPGDDTPDIVPLLNDKFIEPGNNYVYLITDEDNNLVKVHDQSEYDFDNSGTMPNRVFGLSFAGDLNFEIDKPISEITADSCFQLSESTLFLTILKNGCEVIDGRSIGGTIENFMGDPIEGATVRITNGMSTTTNAQGAYLFEGVSTTDAIEVKAVFNDNLLNGVSSTDLVLTARQIIGLGDIVDPYQLLAGDASNDGKLSVTDLVLLRNLLLGRTSELPNNNSWRFLQKSDAGISDFEIVEQVLILAATENVMNVDFIGVKIGDVNGSANTNLGG